MQRLLTIEIADDHRLLRAAVNCIMDICLHLAVEEEKAFKFCFALQEILIERQLEAYAQPGGKFIFDILTEGNRLRVSVTDQGVPYLLNDDRLIFEDKYMEIKLSYLREQSIEFGSAMLAPHGQMFFLELLFQQPFTLEEKKQKCEPPLDTEFSLRKVNANEYDIMEAIKVIYDEYGFAYGNTALYDVEYFQRALKKREFESFLVENKHGEVAGFQALLRLPQFPGMLELASCVVKRRFRNYGLATKGFDDAIARAKQEGMDALLVFPVAHHTVTQHIGFTRDIKATGIMLNFLLTDNQGDLDSRGRRLAIGVAVKMLRQVDAIVAYPPQQHKEFILERFYALGLEVKLKAPAPPQPIETVFKLYFDNRLRNASSYIQTVGQDFDWCVQAFLKDSMLKGVEMAAMFINLRDPACETAFQAGLQHGFHFMGVIPGARGIDYLIMQNFMSNPVLKSSIKVTGEFEHILNYCLDLVPSEMIVYRRKRF